ncbi:hypothetical protein TKK_0011541 [Trichogramma kaykai]
MEVVQNEEPDDANRMIIRTLTFSLYGYEPRIEQEHLILCELSDMNNVIIRPTGFGKSLIYQIAAMLSGGCYIIISPLKSLIRDQVNSMKKAKIECIQWSGEKGAADKRSLSDVNDIVLNDVKIIIATPEAIGIGKGTHDVLEHLVCISYVKRIVFDEAHCLVTWGRTFRDNYIKALQDMRRLCPIVPMSFYSATLTSADIQLIVQMSNMSQHNVQLWREPLRRPNIFLDVIRIKEVQIDVSEEDVVICKNMGYVQIRRLSVVCAILNLPRHANSVVIIYCYTCKTVRTLARHLEKNGFNVRRYTGKETPDDNAAAMADWMSGNVRIIVATSAFGLGVNNLKTDLVIHYDITDSISMYAQMAGRAGRAGQPSHSIFLYSFGDYYQWKSVLMSERAANTKKGSRDREIQRQCREHDFFELITMLENRTVCFHAHIENFFADTNYNAKSCNNACINCNVNSELPKVIIRDALVVVGHVLRVIPKLTLNSLIMLLDGDEPTISCDPPYFDNDYYGHYSALPKNMVAQLLLELMRRRYLLYTTSELEENDNYFDVMVVHWNAAQVTIDQSVNKIFPISQKCECS